VLTLALACATRSFALFIASSEWEQLALERPVLPGDLLLHREWTSAARRTPSIPQLVDVNLQFGDGTAEGVAVHTQFARGAALVALVLFKDGENEFLFEFPYGFRIKNVALVHLQDKSFQLIFHGVSLSLRGRLGNAHPLPCAIQGCAPRNISK